MDCKSIIIIGMCLVSINVWFKVHGRERRDLAMTRLDREQQWEQNTHMKLVSTITTALNLTKCWICHRFPEHSNKRKVPLVGIRIPSLNNHSTWELLWQQPRAFLYNEGSEEAQFSLAKQVIIEESIRCLKSRIGSQSIGEYPDCNYNTTLS